MRYLALTLFVAFFAIIAIFYDTNAKEEETISFPNFDSRIDAFTKKEISRAVRFAQEEYYSNDSITVYIKCVDSAEEAVDFVDGKKLFTGVSMSENGDTLFVCPMAFKTKQGPDKTLYNTVLDELIWN